MEEYIKLLAPLATAIGVVLAVLQLRSNQKQAQNSRDLEISLNLIETFRVRWENNWRVTFREINSEFSKNEKLMDDNLDEFLNMLNWADWFGNLIAHGHLKNEQLIFDAVEPQLKDMLRVGKQKIIDDSEEHGIDHWNGLITVGKILDVEWVVSLEKEMAFNK